jgi:hypothetical protein
MSNVTSVSVNVLTAVKCQCQMLVSNFKCQYQLLSINVERKCQMVMSNVNVKCQCFENIVCANSQT